MASGLPREDVDFLVIGAGISGLAFASAILAEAEGRGRPRPRVLVLEADREPGGYCKTIAQDGFVWDYSGHFFHFRHPEIEAWLRARMAGEEVRTVEKRAFIRHRGRDIDFPFQKNIHQLERDDFLDCLVSLYFREEAGGEAGPRSFRDMLYRRYGRGIAERFLVPYNEKLYACDLDTLDPDAMGRFFPHADVADIIRNMAPGAADNASYNSTFTYPRGGAIQYVRALLHDLPPGSVACDEAALSIDLPGRAARTARREIGYRHLVSSAPLPRLAEMCGKQPDPGTWSWNRVLVFNLGFDRKGPDGVHWIYFPERDLRFYRVGFYDNIMGDDRMSLYVEIGLPPEGEVDVPGERERILRDLERAGVVRGQRLVSWHSVVLDPAYVHITAASQAARRRLSAVLHAGGVYPIGRYGGWTYCSIEDNIVEARALAGVLGELL